MHSDAARSDHAVLRARLEQALVLADRFDPMIAIHVETALALLNERIGAQDQSSER